MINNTIAIRGVSRRGKTNGRRKRGNVTATTRFGGWGSRRSSLPVPHLSSAMGGTRLPEDWSPRTG